MRVLILDEHYREPPLDGGSRSLSDLQRSLAELGHEAVISGNEAQLDSGQWDVVMPSRPMLAARVAERARQVAMSHTVYLGHDLHHRRLAAEDGVLPGQPRPVEVMAALERRCWAQYDLSVYPNLDEVAEVRAAGANARWFPYFRIDEVQTKPRAHQPGAPTTLLFVGGSAHTPNVTGLQWFAESVKPTLRHVRVVVVGRWQPQLQAPLEVAGLDFVGPLPDDELRDLRAEATAHIAPLTAGAGLKSKVIDALASGVPLVASTVAMAGISDPWDIALHADEPHEWHNALVQIDEESSAIRAITDRAWHYVRERHGSSAHLAATADLLDPVAWP